MMLFTTDLLTSGYARMILDVYNGQITVYKVPLSGNFSKAQECSKPKSSVSRTTFGHKKHFATRR